MRRGCWRGLTERGEIRSEEGWPGEVGKGGLRISKGVNQRDILGGLKDYYTRCLRIKESNPGLLCQRKRRSGKTFVRPSEVDVKIILSPKAASEMFQCFNLSKVIREGIIREKKDFL